MRVKLVSYVMVVAVVCMFGFVQNAEAGKAKYFQVADRSRISPTRITSGS